MVSDRPGRAAQSGQLESGLVRKHAQHHKGRFLAAARRPSEVAPLLAQDDGVPGIQKHD
eukprot:CAMPEP_0197694970 /NCGR_PEP_ID=MMETSP1338-20131121/114572_1 /TAXON_ID=43686 ORGANISM="Pelagodinium beii, Strain RCC1491" /NCGR_SAMPLE_ID=MMETSP1338 /ASSEMBLY_ACC=CAM_ASM_000754 /LENGTH=58 /DNA_ID=CAMNT_0043277887 /DNA_START=532 /DNA_END=709 /DNA_ORIENTATION=-